MREQALKEFEGYIRVLRECKYEHEFLLMCGDEIIYSIATTDESLDNFANVFCHEDLSRTEFRLELQQPDRIKALSLRYFITHQLMGGVPCSAK